MKVAFVALFALLGPVLSTTEMDSMGLESMQSAFARSDEAHEASMADMMKSMTVEKAVEVLEKSRLAKGELAHIKSIVLQGKSSLRQAPKKGYAGLDGARRLLNNMIYEAFFKYDDTIMRCVDFYSKQCAALYECRGIIQESNYIAANARALVLDSQARINWCQVEIPTKEYDLKVHNAQCKKELDRMHARLKIVLGDIAIMTSILKMTDCDAANKGVFVQKMNLDVMKCSDQCTKKSFIAFNDQLLQSEVNKIKSRFGKDLVQDTFAAMFDGVKDLQAVEATLLQTDQQPLAGPIINVTNFTEPPKQRVEVPGNPCEGAPYPSAATKRAAKCTLNKGQCYKLQERFLLIQSGMMDERDDLLQSIKELEQYCEEVRNTLLAQIDDAKEMLSEAQLKLAKATSDISNAMSIARTTYERNNNLDDELRKKMKKCNDAYIQYEGEICALKKIRGELYKIKGGGKAPFFQDCEMGEWEPRECSSTCAGGTQRITRKTIVKDNNGAACLPLAAKRNCNMDPCPVDCELAPWSEWGKCSADCNEGVQQRLREVIQAMKYKGKKCGETSETRSCNPDNCDKDCELSEWTKWSACSKDCNGGTMKRSKHIKSPVQGQGKCPNRWDIARLEYKSCNNFGCWVQEVDKPMPCNNSIDVVLLLDGSGSLGKTGWKAEIKMAEMFVDAFAGGVPQGSPSPANVAVILFSGPRTWGGVWRCMGRGPPPDMETVCKIKTVEHFTRDMKDAHNKIAALAWPQGSTLTSLALMTAKSELAYGRKESESIVIVITDGRPLSYRATGIASKQIRKQARLVWVPVTRYAPLGSIKRWATRRWQENVIRVKTFKDLADSSVVTQIMADICPKPMPELM